MTMSEGYVTTDDGLRLFYRRVGEGPLTLMLNGIPVVDEDAKSLHPVDEQEDIAAGSTTSLTVDLKPGRYVAICNLPGHYQQGMYASFTVS